FFYPPSHSMNYSLSLHDALPIFRRSKFSATARSDDIGPAPHLPSNWRRVQVSLRSWFGTHLTCVYRRLHGFDVHGPWRKMDICRSEEHTSELQSRSDLVCRLLLE